MEQNATSWVVSTAAALYWRVMGHAHEAVNCLRSALYHAPDRMKDIPLLSLANILHRQESIHAYFLFVIFSFSIFSALVLGISWLRIATYPVLRAGMLNDALVVANMALEISPKFVVLHFTMANIYASKVNTWFECHEC